MKNLNILQLSVAAIVLLSVGTSCSTTSRVPDDDKLFTGLSKIEYVNYEKNDHFLSTQEEVEAALATAPNGSFLEVPIIAPYLTAYGYIMLLQVPNRFLAVG